MILLTQMGFSPPQAVALIDIADENRQLRTTEDVRQVSVPDQSDIAEQGG
jgi:hypothetical protein